MPRVRPRDPSDRQGAGDAARGWLALLEVLQVSPADRSTAVLRWLVSQPEDKTHSMTEVALGANVNGTLVLDTLDALTESGHVYSTGMTVNHPERFYASRKGRRDVAAK